MPATWSAKGLLKPLWGRVGGRDALARLTGIPAPNLSGYNTGRLRMGLAAGRRIAGALGVSVFELGAPENLSDEPGILLADRLEALEGALLTLVRDGAEFRQQVIERLERLEQPSATEGRPSTARTAP